jgi:hypothetical protein
MKSSHEIPLRLALAFGNLKTSRKKSALFAWLISHQPAVLFSQNKPATSNQPTVLFSQNKPAPAISHQPNEQAEEVHSSRTWKSGLNEVGEWVESWWVV